MPFAPVGTPAPPSRALPRMAIALLACLALYGIVLACMATVPATGFDFASGFAVPEMEIARRDIRYRSPVYFTPLLDESHVDGIITDCPDQVLAALA